MNNPLDSILQSYKSTLQAFQVVRRCAKAADPVARNPLRRTGLYSLPPEELGRLVDSAQEEIEHLMVLSLFATFERTLREIVKTSIANLSVVAVGLPVQDSFYDFLQAEADQWGMDKIVQFFRPLVDDDDIAQAGSIRSFRHWVAHGRSQIRKPPSLTLKTAHSHLTAFLQKIGAV